MGEVILGNVPHQKLQILFHLFQQFVPGEFRINALAHVFVISIENVLHVLLFVVYRNLVDLELNRLLVVQTLSNKLEVGDWFVTVQVLILIPHFENELVCGILHRHDDSEVLQDHAVESSDYLVDPT